MSIQSKDEPGMKFDAGKPRWDLFYLPFLTDLHAVLVYGEQKYAAWNWSKGMSYSRLFNATMRHLWAWWWKHEMNDPESGLPHLAHAACCIMFLAGLQDHNRGTDDRPQL